MTNEVLYIFLVLLIALGLFIWGRWRYDLVALAALISVAIPGLVPAERAFEGFSHPAVITVAAVLILSKGLLNAGVVDALARMLSKIGGGAVAQMSGLTLLTAVCSGFMNNVGALALLMPVAIWLARRGGYSPSLVLMPLAFGSLLGGMTTLIGTPPNLIVASFRPESAGAPFGMFDFAYVGSVVTLAGVLTITCLARFLVPARTGNGSDESLFAIDDYLTELRIPEQSKAVGTTLFELESKLRENDADIHVIAIIRGKHRRTAPSPYSVLRSGDLLLVEADPEDLKVLMDSTQLELAESLDEGEGSLDADDIQLLEAVVTHRSSLLGKTAASIDLRQNYRVNLLAVARQGRKVKQQLSHIRFVLGDIVLLQGSSEALTKTVSDLGCLPLEQRELPLGKRRRIALASSIFLAGLVVSASGLMPVQITLTTAAMVMVLLGILSLREAYDSIDWPIIVLLAAMLPVGEAFERSGAAQLIADQVVWLSAAGSIWAVLALLMVVTMLLSNVINNAAAAVLMAPIAVRVAESMELSVDGLLMGIAVSASAAFLTPIGHQSNALVFEPGGYRFGDYWPLGSIVSLVVLASSIPMIVFVWCSK
jgi:di/tricarboxylate transporter